MGSHIDDAIWKIKEEQIGTTPGKSALIVEGVSDASFYNKMLTARDPNWESRFCIAVGDGKKGVVEIVGKETGWFGIVDRDEWSDDVLDKMRADYPNLWICPRFCMENYLIVPQELWAAFPQKQRDKIPGRERQLRETILNGLEQWVAHGVLWSVVNPLWEGLRSLGFKEDLLSPDVALDNDRIRKKLDEWHQFLAPEQIMARFEETLRRVSALPQNEQLMRWVHGKSFYTHVVNPTLNALLGQKAEKERRTDIIRTLPLPDDLSGLWDMLRLKG